MVSKSTHDDYIRLYKELIDRANDKEDIIQRMTRYIVRNAELNKSICKKDKVKFCNEKQCLVCVRNHFERKKRCK